MMRLVRQVALTAAILLSGCAGSDRAGDAVEGRPEGRGGVPDAISGARTVRTGMEAKETVRRVSEQKQRDLAEIGYSEDGR